MNSDKLNSIIRKKSKSNNNLAHHLHQMFFFEHVLMRLEKSKYRDNIILKGGVLLSSIIGENLRTTKDIDATLKSLPLNIDSIKNIFEEILAIDINDNVMAISPKLEYVTPHKCNTKNVTKLANDKAPNIIPHNNDHLSGSIELDVIESPANLNMDL